MADIPTKEIDKLRSVEEIEDFKKECLIRLDELASEPGSLEAKQLREILPTLDEKLEHLREREAYMRRELANPRAQEREETFIPPGMRGVRDNALYTIERAARDFDTAAQRRIEEVVRSDKVGIDSQYLQAVAQPEYERAFGKVLFHGQDAFLQMSDDERAAVQRVGEVTRAMGLSPGSAGGFGVPFVLDPTINLSSAGRLNPIRDLARVETISGSNEWRGVSSDGVVANWYAEAAEVSDDSPTLAQPTVTARRASAFVPFSIEIGMDYLGLTNELSRLIVDAKNTLESDAFHNGLAANNAPIGILATTGGLGAGQRVPTGTTAAYTVSSNYALKSAIPARFIGSASIVGNPSFFDAAYRLVGGGSTEPPVMATREGAWLGLPKAEWSSMAYNLTNGTKIAVAGDFEAGYVIVDRVGMSVDLVPHLFGTNRRPSGQRGVFAYWRVGAALLVANALRFLEVNAT